MGEELNLRDLGSVLNALKRDGENIKDILEKVTNRPHQPTIPPTETQALYLNAAALFNQLPKKHPLHEQFNSAYLDGLAQLASSENYRQKYQEAMEHARSAYVKAGQSCCTKRIADDIADLFASQGTVIPQEVQQHILPNQPHPSSLRAYIIREATDDDGEIMRDSTQAVVSCSDEFGQGRVWLNVNPPYTIKGLREKLKEHNLISIMFIDDLYYEYGTPTDHPAYPDVKKGRQFLEDFFEPCACPTRKKAESIVHQESLAVFEKRYSLENDVVDGLKDVSTAIGCKTTKGWKNLLWYAILPAPLAQEFMAHTQHAMHDVLDAHGKPEGIEWKVNSVVYPGGMYVDGKDQIPAEKKGALVIVNCAYDKSKFSPLIYNGKTPPITALVSDIERELDIQDSLGIMQIHSIKRPDKDWERCSPSRLLF
jgi:hypothetical protein